MPGNPSVFDAHLHLDDRGDVSVEQAVRRLRDEMDEACVDKAIVLHLAWQKWSLEDVASAVRGVEELIPFANVQPGVPEILEHAASLGFRGLKLHPRLQKYRPNAPECVALVRRAQLDMPVVIDCFPDGDWLMDGLSLLQYADLARQAPSTRIVVAHAAGHHCQDLLMLMKRVPNLWTDLSYSLLYYVGPTVDALFYCMKSLRYERVLFGTDYPDRSLKESVRKSLLLFDRFGVTGEARDRVLWKNAHQLLLRPSA